MKFLIIFAVTLGCALADGRTQYLADSPDVASAKLAHFEAKAKAAAAVGAAPDYVTSYYLNYYKNLNAPAAAITVLPNGFLADTPEVAAAKAGFNAEFAKATAAAAANPEYSNDYYKSYNANQNNANSNQNNFNANQNNANANQNNANANQNNFNANQNNAYANNANPNTVNQNNANPNYYIPANIVVQPNGYLADTPEVAAAKAGFNAEFAKATAAAAANPEYSNDYYNYYYKTYYANQNNVNANQNNANANQNNAYANNANPNTVNQNNANPNYYIPANIVVQPDGYLADTPEVAAAKASHNTEVAIATAAAAAAANNDGRSRLQ